MRKRPKNTSVSDVWLADVDRLYLLLQLQREIKNGSSDGTRTCDILINSQTLYQLSYRGIYCGNYLLSRVVSNEVPSACGRLTAVFGMGTGGTVRASSPHTDLSKSIAHRAYAIGLQVVHISVPRVKSKGRRRLADTTCAPSVVHSKLDRRNSFAN